MGDKKIIGSIGMPQSGTHMLANMLGGLLENNPEYSYKPLIHARKGYVNVMPIKRRDWHAMFYYYRNQIDRVMGTIVRRHMSDRKNALEPSIKADVNDYKEFISNKIREILLSKQGLMEMHDRYSLAVMNKDLVIETCNDRNILCFIAPYERSYENLDFICDCLDKCGIKIKNKIKMSVKKKFSVDAIYDFCRTPEAKKWRMLTNHVSHSRGEPYYWAKLFDFKEFYHSLPEENQALFKNLVKNHIHKNLPEECFEEM